MSEAEESSPKISYVPYRDGEPSRVPGDNSGDSDSSYYSSPSDDELEKGPGGMNNLAGGSFPAKRKRLSFHPKGSKRKILEIVSMAVAIVIVLGIFSLPTSFYIREYTEVHDDETINITATAGPSETNGSCQGLSFGVPPSLVCSPEPYTGSNACRNYLLAWENCILDNSDLSLFVSLSESSQSESEEYASIFFSLLANFGESTTPECKELSSNFICLYLFPLCGTDGELYLPSREMCLEVSVDVCQQEWATAQVFDVDNMLPDCDNLPTSASNSSGISVSMSSVANITCNSMFALIDGICVPNCYTFFSGSEDRLMLNVITLAVAVIFGLITSFVLSVASFWRRKIMWRFPYVFLMYVTIEYTIVAIFILISLTNRGLFCSNISVVETNNNPTVYCTINGIVIHYFLISMAYFWFFHVCSTFYKVVFPHLAKRAESKQGVIHVVLVFLALALPLPPVIVVLSNSDYEYSVPTYPPYSCVSKSFDVVVPISMLLVLNVLFAAGTSLFIPMLWAIHKHHKALRGSRRKRKWRISIVEHKLILTLSYFILFGTMTLVLLAVLIADQDEYGELVQEFIQCEAPGFNASLDCESILDPLTKYSNLGTATYTLLGLFPLVILAFTINWKLVVKKTKAFLIKRGLKRIKEDPGAVVFSTYSPLSSTTVNAN